MDTDHKNSYGDIPLSGSPLATELRTMETKQRERRRPIDEQSSSVSLLEVDQNVSKVFGMAQKRPILVNRYGSPFAVVLSTTMWSGASKQEDYLPPRSPLTSIRKLVEQELEARSHTLMPRLKSVMTVEPGQALRALLLQVLYSIPTEASLRDQIMANMVFRWFVGLHLNTPLWDLSHFARDLRTVLEHADAVEFLLETTQLIIATRDHCAVDLDINIALARSWAMRHPSLCRRVPYDDYSGGPMILLPDSNPVKLNGV